MVGPASPSCPSIIYEPLAYGSNQIRILQLLPGPFDDRIRCRILISDLNSSFEALSYVWGDPKDARMIEVQGAAIRATKNLETALRHIRDTREPRRLWVDAICINQNNSRERTHQVGMMEAIYRGADKVVVWLGDEQAEPALELIKIHGSQGGRHWRPQEEGNHRQGRSITPHHVWMLMVWLKNTKWLRRIWTVQEVVLAKSVTYLCGEYLFANGEIDGLFQSFTTHFVQDKCCDMDAIMDPLGFGNMRSQIWEYLHQISDMIETGKRKGSGRFLDIASKFRHRDATDPRDKVFGILGLTDEVTKDIVDYDAPVSDIYARTAISLIDRTGNLDVLSHVLPRSLTQKAQRFQVATSRPPGLASWVPDWSDTREYENWRLQALIQREAFTDSFRACGRESAPCLRVSGADLQKLVLKGRSCGTISLIGAPCEEDAPGHYRLDCHQEWRKMAGVDTRPEQKYGNKANPAQPESTVLDAFWRTACANIDPFRSSPDKVCEADMATRLSHDRWWWHRLQIMKYGENITTDMRRSLVFASNEAFHSHVICISAGRRFFISSAGLFGLAPQDALEGDQIWVVNGGKKPLILRSLSDEYDRDEGEAFTFVGDSYVHGIMNGEVIEDGTPERTVVLI